MSLPPCFFKPDISNQETDHRKRNSDPTRICLTLETRSAKRVFNKNTVAVYFSEKGSGFGLSQTRRSDPVTHGLHQQSCFRTVIYCKISGIIKKPGFTKPFRTLRFQYGKVNFIYSTLSSALSVSDSDSVSLSRDRDLKRK
jgi:hypothetical protein